jgi:hypothetical protein
MKEDVKHYVHICVKCQNIKLIYKNEFRLYRSFIDFNKFVWECINGFYYMSFGMTRRRCNQGGGR